MITIVNLLVYLNYNICIFLANLILLYPFIFVFFIFKDYMKNINQKKSHTYNHVKLNKKELKTKIN